MNSFKYVLAMALVVTKNIFLSTGVFFDNYPLKTVGQLRGYL
jgi:hypothetical protein